MASAAPASPPLCGALVGKQGRFQKNEIQRQEKSLELIQPMMRVKPACSVQEKTFSFQIMFGQNEC